jgi:hypothetical protein
MIDPGPNPNVTWTTPPVAEGVAVAVLVAQAGSWPPPSGSGALGTPATSCCSCATSLDVSGHDAKTSLPDAPAAQVVNIAFPAQVAGVQAVYTLTATAVSSSTVAAAVVAGLGVGVAAGDVVGATVGAPVVLDVGLGGEPHDISSINTAIGAPAANRVGQIF